MDQTRGQVHRQKTHILSGPFLRDEVQNHEKGNEFCQKAVELGDQDITTLYNYAVVLMNLGKSAEAKVTLENLLKLDPDYADAYYHLAILAIGQGETEKAKEFL
jgi:tetratricopeptide (TPR) repeat protein